jgi:hypothetical protein
MHLSRLIVRAVHPLLLFRRVDEGFNFFFNLHLCCLQDLVLSGLQDACQGLHHLHSRGIIHGGVGALSACGKTMTG